MTQNILLIGAGAVGSAVAAWLAPKHNNLYVFDRPQTLAAIAENGITAYWQQQKNQGETITVNTIANLADGPKPDVILLCVKNYSLDGLSQAILAAYGKAAVDNCIVVGLQNGVENQHILPQYFNNIVYGIVTFNAWLDAPGIVGYQAKGPFIFGTPDNHNQASVLAITELFNQAVVAVASTHFQDAALCKMILNLTNSLTTLTGVGYREIDDMSLFQRILSRLTYEGVKIVKAAGFKECQVGDTPGWHLIKASALLPQFLTRGFFKRNVKKMVLSSMAQDVILHGRGNTELRDINGYLLTLAERHNIAAPYNQAIYQLCQKRFAQETFEPMSVKAVWREMAV